MLLGLGYIIVFVFDKQWVKDSLRKFWRSDRWKNANQYEQQMCHRADRIGSSAGKKKNAKSES
ncbi:MAG: hypothetical protein VR65_05910 [Desulfobulbaceae bacterium BRH_c16a]|nr:MAG: hypothetical protein VR65_08795 [Desulfobulbaceae bacterium BRH_c16a]KJS02331.1 MAG: hypothetical protein VR65_05910 [Desulfobulbaceae bacterium BRH_c16a]